MKIKKELAIEDFFDFSTGVKWTEEEQLKFVEEVVTKLKQLDKDGYEMVASGNILVWGERYGDEISVYICPNYKELNTKLDNLK